MFLCSKDAIWSAALRPGSGQAGAGKAKVVKNYDSFDLCNRATEVVTSDLGEGFDRRIIIMEENNRLLNQQMAGKQSTGNPDEK